MLVNPSTAGGININSEVLLIVTPFEHTPTARGVFFSSFLSSFSGCQVTKLADALEERTFMRDEYIIRQGKPYVERSGGFDLQMVYLRG